MRIRVAALAVPILLASAALVFAAQQTGGLEFSTRIAPTAGRPEPARLHPFYLLRKSHADIQKEAEETEPKPDLEKFVDGLDVSKELKAWMKRTKTVQFTAGDFNKRALVDDVFDVPEFFEAYITQNAGDPMVPSPKYSERDREKNPQRYEKQQQEYRAQLRKFARQNPHTMTGIEVHLSQVDPGQRWTRLDYDRRNRVRFRALELAQTKYLVARIETDIEGRAAVTNVLPGDYWLSTLGEEAVAGDARLRWDAPVKVAAGRVTRVELSNVNAVSTSPSK